MRQVQLYRDGGVDELEERQKLLMEVAAVELGDDRAAGQVERCEQAGRAVADLVMVIRAGVVGSIGEIGAVRSS